MKNIKINSKKIFVILLSGFIIITSSGCSNNKKEVDNYNYDNGYTVENFSQNHSNEQQSSASESTSSENNLTANENSKQEETIENKTSSTVDEELTIEDKEVIAYFNELKINVNEVLNSEEVEIVKDKLKGTFITVVDFIFYDCEIKGIKFDDLTEGAKQNILETASMIDNVIMTKFPNYKKEIGSTVSNAYNKASELIKNGANNISDFSREKLGEENYNAIIESKDELVDYTKNALDIVGDVAGTIWDKGTENIKNWYENFKNN